uniref:COBRA C-terminal domain-containing protein n=1 Tax=Aegilops tauschii subsp. strangulata TaxID=200361 RepID=A0A453CJC5_AEGTS
MADHLLVLAVQGRTVAVLLRLPHDLLQQHDRGVPAGQLRWCKLSLGASVPQLPDAEGAPPVPVIRCTEHMCPIRVHWHVKQSYRGYWRVKTTVTNYDVVSNYTDWNLVVQHPNLRSLTQLFSFNYQPLIQYGTINDTGMFWGIKNYNEMLLGDGNVQTEMILEKDPSDFTFSGGWAFPRRVYFNGHECVMPPPDQYPSLPNAARDVRVSAVQRWLVASSCVLSLSMLFLV